MKKVKGSSLEDPVHTYPDISESATFSFPIQIFHRPHEAYSNRIRLTTRIPLYPDSLLRNKAYLLCRHIGLLFDKRLDTILLRDRIRQYSDSPSTRYRIRCGFIFFSSTLTGGLKNNRTRWIRVDGAEVMCFYRSPSPGDGHVFYVYYWCSLSIP